MIMPHPENKHVQSIHTSGARAFRRRERMAMQHEEDTEQDSHLPKPTERQIYEVNFLLAQQFENMGANAEKPEYEAKKQGINQEMGEEAMMQKQHPLSQDPKYSSAEMSQVPWNDKNAAEDLKNQLQKKLQLRLQKQYNLTNSAAPTLTRGT
jgi:hypothetical protein